MFVITGCSSDEPWDSTYQHRYQILHIFSLKTASSRPVKTLLGLTQECAQAVSLTPLEWESFLAKPPIQLAPERKWAPLCNYIICF